MKKYEFLEHTADIKAKAYGTNIEDLFEHIVLAFSECISRENKIEENITKKVKITGKNTEEILYKFIDELIYLLDAEEFVVSKAEVQIDRNELNAKLHGDDASHYDDLDHVKAATYSEMHIKKKGKIWEAQFVLDV